MINFKMQFKKGGKNNVSQTACILKQKGCESVCLDSNPGKGRGAGLH